MDNTPLFQSLRMRNLLSYGDDAEDVPLGPLNVLIGPDTSGKSNFMEAVGLLRATPRDLAGTIRRGGGVAEWLWKGGNSDPVAQIEAVVSYPGGVRPLRYRLAFTAVGQRLEVVDEAIENDAPTVAGAGDVFFFYRYQSGRPVFSVRPATTENAPPGTDEGRQRRHLQREDLLPDQSVLSQRKDPDQYPEVTYLGGRLDSIRLFRNWNLGPDSAPRQPQRADAPDGFLEEDAGNLGLVLNYLDNRSETRRTINDELRRFYHGFEDITTRIYGNTVQVLIHEAGLREPIPASRLSDGTLRYLCLLTLLCHPSPPPVLCIDEPELGLHPDALARVAELLVEASTRTQLIVTTHSDALVSGLSSTPDAVLVCERDGAGSCLRRLQKEPLAEWLENYLLGDVWRMGEIGGNPK